MLTAPSPTEVTDLNRWRAASDAELLSGLEAARARGRQAQAAVAVISAEVARRSAPEAGHAGLAQRTGARTPEKLVARITGTSEREAREMVAAGRLTADAPPWLARVAEGVRDGSLSVGQATAISSGLGEPSARVAADDLQDAALRLAGEAATLDADRLARRAREERDALDAAGVVDRERELRSRRSLRWARLPDGMTSLRALLDPESAAVVTAALDAVTSPRRGGPRFVDADEVTRARDLQDDPRSTEQLALDALVHMVRAAVAVDDGRMLGQRQPTVRLHVRAEDLRAGSGAARLEGQAMPVSIATAERLMCAEGYLPLVIERDGSIDVGRAQRLFTARQRRALDAIWGGCAFPDCERPPSWTEAHHAIPWSQGGRSDVANGILLCRHHHLLIHDSGWSIDPPPRPGGRWRIRPPADDPLRRPATEITPRGALPAAS